MKHEARSTKFETNSKVKKFQTGSGVLNFRIFPSEADPPLAENLDIVSDFGFRISDFQKCKAAGFTLLETVVALAILTAAIVGPMSLVSSGILSARASKNLTIASYLAEEGVEIVRAIKEDNALAGRTGTGNCNNSNNWNYGLCEGAWRADVETFSLLTLPDELIGFDAGSPGFYSYSGSSKTIFKRRVEIERPNGAEDDVVSGKNITPPHMLDVVVTVSWREGLGGMRDVIFQERFYNWQ